MTRKMRILTTFVVLSMVFAAGNLFGDVIGAAAINVTITVNEVAAITVSGGAISFTVGAGAAAGDLPAVTPGANTPTYLQYSSIIQTGLPRSMAVQVDNPMPDGLILNIRAGTPTGHGNAGTPVAGGVTVDTNYVADTDQTIITTIESCATGTGATQGPPIFYSLAIDEATFEDLVITAVPLVVVATYTLVGT